jgi:hypothetical protein
MSENVVDLNGDGVATPPYISRFTS